MKKADIGLVGLAVMGENLVMNMESRGFTVAVFNRTTEKVTKFVEGRAKGKNIIGTYSLQELADSLEKPRKIMMMVKAGQAVDSLIDNLCEVSGEVMDTLTDSGVGFLKDQFTAIFPTPSAVPSTWRARVFCTWAAACPAARRAR